MKSRTNATKPANNVKQGDAPNVKEIHLKTKNGKKTVVIEECFPPGVPEDLQRDLMEFTNKHFAEVSKTLDDNAEAIAASIEVGNLVSHFISTLTRVIPLKDKFGVLLADKVLIAALNNSIIGIKAHTEFLDRIEASTPLVEAAEMAERAAREAAENPQGSVPVN